MANISSEEKGFQLWALKQGIKYTHYTKTLSGALYYISEDHWAHSGILMSTHNIGTFFVEK